MVVRFYTDKLTEDFLQGRSDFNISIWKYPSTEEEIHSRIKECAPWQWFKLLESDTNLDHMVEHVGKEFEYEFEEPEEPKPELSDEEIEELIKKL